MSKSERPFVGDLIEISLGPFDPKEKNLPDGTVEVYSGGAKFVRRTEKITKRGRSYFAQCGQKKSHLHINLQTPSLAKSNSWLVWCQLISKKKRGVWQTNPPFLAIKREKKHE